MVITVKVFYGTKHHNCKEWKHVYSDDGRYLLPQVRLYYRGGFKPHYPVPAIPLQVRYPDEHPWAAPEGGYMKMIYIDALNYGDDDPVMVCCWDFFNNNYWYGKHQHCYIDEQTKYWDRLGVEWRREEPEKYLILLQTKSNLSWVEHSAPYGDDLLKNTDEAMAEVEKGQDFLEMAVISFKSGKKVFGYSNQDGLVAYLTNWFGG